MDSQKIHVGRNTSVEVEIYNSGDAIATNCELRFVIDGTEHHKENFNVKPMDSHRSKFKTPIFQNVGQITAIVNLNCNETSGYSSANPDMALINFVVDKCEDSSLEISNVSRSLSIRSNEIFRVAPYISNNCFADVKISVLLDIRGTGIGNGLGFFSEEASLASGATFVFQVASNRTLPTGRYNFSIKVMNAGFPTDNFAGQLRVY
jgi:hypothetical protein